MFANYLHLANSMKPALGGHFTTLRPVGFDSRPVCPGVGPVGPTHRAPKEWTDRSARPVGFSHALAIFSTDSHSPLCFSRTGRTDRSEFFTAAAYFFLLVSGPQGTGQTDRSMRFQKTPDRSDRPVRRMLNRSDRPVGPHPEAEICLQFLWTKRDLTP